MCGIVGAVAARNVDRILIEGLRRLEYRGYDSAGVALVVNNGGSSGSVIDAERAVGKVAALAEKLGAQSRPGTLGIAHTRWATHGGVTQANAHPHLSNDRIGVVHNGIIENFEALRRDLSEAGYTFASETDTEVIAHLIDSKLDAASGLADAVRQAVSELSGAYALAVVCNHCPDTLVAVRKGSPLVVGVGIGEHFVASDVEALLPVTQRFVYLEEGDMAVVTAETLGITDVQGSSVTRPIKESTLSVEATEKGGYRHFMRKEIFAQPRALADTLHGRFDGKRVLLSGLGAAGEAMLDRVEAIHIVACGTSYHAGLVARYWIEAMARIPCNVELASEYRYREPVVPGNCLLITLSQSGETADTLAALRYARSLPAGSNYLATLAICNKPETSLTRESDLVMLTRAGPEIGVASTKAFTTQLLSLLLITAMVNKTQRYQSDIAAALCEIDPVLDQVLALEPQIELLSEHFTDRAHALFLGRGPMVPIAMEGALKLKEISYIHAEAYAAGELKHGPLALVDENMPVVAVAPNNELVEKVKSNLAEVRARHGQLYVFADGEANMESGEGVSVINLPHAPAPIAPIAYTIPLQLLAYHVAVARGTDVDQPRNLAKSVTVE